MARKATLQAAQAFVDGEKLKLENTEVRVEDGKVRLYLFGNLIAERYAGRLKISSAGCDANITRERLNGLPRVNIYVKRGQWYLNSEPWNGGWTEV
jgi:hypothetical protein